MAHQQRSKERNKHLPAGDPFSDIRSLWAGCAACHGADGGGGIGPKLAGQSSDYISEKLYIYKNNGNCRSAECVNVGTSRNAF